jgi:hypothetical protein
MRFALAIFCMLACATSALAQYGISNTRDGNGNLIRNTGINPARGINQGPINNGPINNGPINSAPAQPPTTNSRMNSGTIR